MNELIYMRDNGENGIELTDISDLDAVVYVRADCVRDIKIKEKQDLFVGGAERNEAMIYPCDTCKHHYKDILAYPCGACVYS